MSKEELFRKMEVLCKQYEESNDNDIIGCILLFPTTEYEIDDLYEWDGEVMSKHEWAIGVTFKSRGTDEDEFGIQII
jgi:uncharacterized protein involved in tolerance to divalent cations